MSTKLPKILSGDADFTPYVTIGKPDDVTLLEDATETGAGVLVADSGEFHWHNVATDWNGASAQLQFSHDDATWVDEEGLVQSENGGFKPVTISAGYWRVEVTGSPTGLSSWLYGVS